MISWITWADLFDAWHVIVVLWRITKGKVPSSLVGIQDLRQILSPLYSKRSFFSPLRTVRNTIESMISLIGLWRFPERKVICWGFLNVRDIYGIKTQGFFRLFSGVRNPFYQSFPYKLSIPFFLLWISHKRNLLNHLRICGTFQNEYQFKRARTSGHDHSGLLGWPTWCGGDHRETVGYHPARRANHG